MATVQIVRISAFIVGFSIIAIYGMYLEIKDFFKRIKDKRTLKKEMKSLK